MPVTADAIAELGDAFNDFKTNIRAEVARLSRPHFDGGGATDEHRKAFDLFVRTGDESQLRTRAMTDPQLVSRVPCQSASGFLT